METRNKCLAHCNCLEHGRREFLKKTVLLTAGTSLMSRMAFSISDQNYQTPIVKFQSAASKLVPVIKSAFVRRKEEYGMLWPGAVYDGDAAFKNYSEQLANAAKSLNVKLVMKERPIFNIEEAEVWINESKQEKVDGLILVVLDRQEHSWPTAGKVAVSGLPAIIFSPLGTSFTTNTEGLANIPGCVIYSTNDFNQVIYGMKMLKVKAKMRNTRCVVIKGDIREEKKLAETGITLQYIPASTFIDIYNNTAEDDRIISMTDEYINKAEGIRYATRQDVINGIKSYLVAGKLLEDEKADAISMDCLGALGKEKVSLPCIAWSRMNDDGIPAACEADVGAIASQVIVQYLFDRPGFQQDPVADTADDTIIGAHCSCPTRLNGFDMPSEPFDLVHHHGNRDAVPRTKWKINQKITCIDFLPGNNATQECSKMLISVGTVIDNMSVPPSGGCVVSVKVKFDNHQNVLTYPGFHQLFIYGDYKDELVEFCQLCNFEAKII